MVWDEVGAGLQAGPRADLKVRPYAAQKRHSDTRLPFTLAAMSIRVLFCADGSEQALAALRQGARFIRGAGARACVLYVVPDVDERFRHYERLHEDELKEIEHLFGDQAPGVEVLGRAREALQQEGVEADRKLRQGDPAEEILAEVREGGYDLVVLASRGHSRVERFLLGSVSQRVCEAAEASVLVVKPRAGQGDGDGGARHG